MTHNYNTIKYDKLDNQSECSDEDVPLLSLDRQENINNYNQPIDENSDTESVLLEINNNNNVNKQKILDNSSRNIVRFYIFTLIIISFCFTFTILGYIDYKNTSSDNIIYDYYGKLLFSYYYIINICWYITFILFSLYLILYIICCSSICHPIREISFFKFLKLNLFVLNLNILTKICYCFLIMLLSDYEYKVSLNKIPKYYNYIIMDIIIFMITQIYHFKFIDNINNFIDT